MHGKYRNGPGNGYRPNPMGMGTGRISPEGSMRGQQRMYNNNNPEYRNFNNRGGYGRAKQQFQQPPPPPPPCGPDMFVEAGRLAAEYLVSKGVIPPNALSGNWQSDGFKNQAGNFQGFRSREVENSQIYGDGRLPAHSRSGNAASLDVGPVGRRYSDEYSSMGAMMRNGLVKTNGSEVVNNDPGKSVGDISRDSPGLEGDSHASIPGENGNNGEIKNTFCDEITQEMDSEARVESGLEKSNSKLVEDENAKAESTKTFDDDDANKLNDEAEAVEDGKNDDYGFEQKHCENKEATASVKEDSVAGEDHVDLVKQSKFVDVPTKARSSLTNKGSKGAHDLMNEDDNNSKIASLEGGSGVHVIDDDDDDDDSGNPACNGSALQNHELKSVHTEAEKEPHSTNKAREGYCLRSRSFPQRLGYEEEDDDEGISGLSRSNSMFMERSGKRKLDDDAGDDILTKLQKLSDSHDQSNSGSRTLSSSMENKPILQDRTDSSGIMEEKQLFPSSSKSWDLNLIGENHDGGGAMHIFPSVAQTGKVETPIDVDLSVSNNLPNKNGKNGANNNDIEIIDLENDSAQEDKIFSNIEQRGANVFTDLEGSGLPDVEDGYDGLMLSELLGSSVSTDLNSLHNHMRLPDEEEILGDDESIYMSLGEIPISLLGPWEQPPPNYGKPF